MAWVVALTLFAADAGADAPPWRRRRPAGLVENRTASALVDPADWPAEPASPAVIDEARFARALHELCGWMPPGRDARYAHWLATYAAEFGEDPFLIGALIYRQSHCRPEA